MASKAVGDISPFSGRYNLLLEWLPRHMTGLKPLIELQSAHKEKYRLMAIQKNQKLYSIIVFKKLTNKLKNNVLFNINGMNRTKLLTTKAFYASLPITAFPPRTEIAFAGQFSAHLPHPTHFDEITSGLGCRKGGSKENIFPRFASE